MEAVAAKPREVAVREIRDALDAAYAAGRTVERRRAMQIVESVITDIRVHDTETDLRTMQARILAALLVRSVSTPPPGETR